MVAAGCGGGSLNKTAASTPTPTASVAIRVVLAFRLQNGGLILTDKEGGNEVIVTSDVTSAPSWSPDGKSVVFSDSSADGTTHIYVATTDGKMHRLLRHEFPGVGDVAWAPDGKHLVVHVQGANQYEGDVAVLDLATEKLRRVTQGPGDDKSAQVSPDGKWIVFKREVGNLASIWVVGWDGRNLRRLVPDRMLAAHPWWAPDSETIVFNDGSGTVGVGHGKSHIFTIRRDGTHERQLTFGTTLTDFHPSWSPDGKTIYFTRYIFSPQSIPFAIYRMSPDGTNIEQVNIDRPSEDLNDASVAPAGY